MQITQAQSRQSSTSCQWWQIRQPKPLVRDLSAQQLQQCKISGTRIRSHLASSKYPWERGREEVTLPSAWLYLQGTFYKATSVHFPQAQITCLLPGQLGTRCPLVHPGAALACVSRHQEQPVYLFSCSYEDFPREKKKKEQQKKQPFDFPTKSLSLS